MKKRRLIAVFLLVATLFGKPAFAEYEEGYDIFERFSSFAANLYIDETVTTDDVMQEALRAVLKEKPELVNELIKAGFQSLDDYSEYYTAEEYELFRKNMDHIVYGIGVIIQQIDEYVTVMSVVSGGGAESAGVIPGDKISKVNGVDAKGLSVDKVQDMVLGELGTKVTITFLREGMEFDREIVRQEVRGTTVGGTILEGKIGYIDIINFAENTAGEFSELLWEFDAAGVTDIILDLRNNPGGYLGSAVDVARQIVPEGVIVNTVYREEINNESFHSNLKEKKYNFCVLINENTASAAEVLASALSESGAGILIGQQSYGKGVIQSMFQMTDGTAFKITTGKYFTRNGNDINGGGIEPDEYIENETRLIDLTRYKTFDYKTKPMVGSVSQNVQAAKERLRILGYYHGAVDESFDADLAAAITNFQADNELYPYGVLDISTQVKIENTFYKIEEEVDTQLIYAYEYFGGSREALGF